MNSDDFYFSQITLKTCRPNRYLIAVKSKRRPKFFKYFPVGKNLLVLFFIIGDFSFSNFYRLPIFIKFCPFNPVVLAIKSVVFVFYKRVYR